MKRTTLMIIILFSLMAWSCNRHPVEKEESGDVIHVSLEAVGSIQYALPVRTTGLLETGSEIKLSFKTGGIIRKIHVNEGDAVKRGKVLAELDLSEVKAQVKQATIGMEKAERDLIRAENLYRDSVVTLEQYQDAQSARDLAQARMKVADFNLNHSRIEAPESGNIQKILAEPSEMIAPGNPVILFASTEGDWLVRAAVTDKDVVRISLGDSAVVTMDAFPGERFAAMVVEVGTIADPYTGSYEVEMAIYRPLKQFRTGFFSRATLYPASKERYLVVPMEALLDAKDNLASIYVWENGKAVMKKIRTGLIMGGHVVVLEGVNEGDLVVTDGAKFIRKGSVVNPVNQKEGSHP